MVSTAASEAAARPRRPGLSAIEVRRFPGADCPPELGELRRLVWDEETGLLPEEGLFGENDRHGVHVLVYDPAGGGRLVGAVCVVEAEHSDFAPHTRFPPDVLRDTMLTTRATVHPDYRGAGLFALLMYLGAREGRVRGRRWMAGYLDRRKVVPGGRVIGAAALDQVPPRRVRGRGGEYEVVATAADVNYAMSKCFRRVPEGLHPYLREHCFADEIVTSVVGGARRFHAGPWFGAVADRALTRTQYVRTLANMHAYVRWTTRLLGAVVGITPDRDLRRHYIRHLRGEIDHEVMLERDLGHLGADVDYVKHHMSPTEDIRTFMSLQEALCTGPRRDPSLFLAIPFAVEALSGFLTQEFLGRLAENIASWGVADPAPAMTFLTSHVGTDGGDDGHWDAARQILHRQVRGEGDLQEFLSIARLAQDCQHRAFTSYVTETDIFAASPRGP
jgi:hypothetical protein